MNLNLCSIVSTCRFFFPMIVVLNHIDSVTEHDDAISLHGAEMRIYVCSTFLVYLD